MVLEATKAREAPPFLFTPLTCLGAKPLPLTGVTTPPPPVRVVPFAITLFATAVGLIVGLLPDDGGDLSGALRPVAPVAPPLASPRRSRGTRTGASRGGPSAGLPRASCKLALLSSEACRMASLTLTSAAEGSLLCTPPRRRGGTDGAWCCRL